MAEFPVQPATNLQHQHEFGHDYLPRQCCGECSAEKEQDSEYFKTAYEGAVDELKEVYKQLESERRWRKEAARHLKRNVLVIDKHRFEGKWVAIPFEAFDALRAELLADQPQEGK